MAIIAPSLLSADFLHLEEDCKMLDQSEADWFHVDVMDGRFVPNISFGMPIIKQIRTTTKKFFDVHLMIVEPDKYIESFKDAGADGITVHFETCDHLNRSINFIKSLGLKAGVAINPHTPVSFLSDIIFDVDMVLVMTINPGFGGQTLIPHTMQKITDVKNMINRAGLDIKVEVDGGVTLDNAKHLLDAGADILVAGNAVFKSKDPIETIRKLKSINN